MDGAKTQFFVAPAQFLMMNGAKTQFFVAPAQFLVINGAKAKNVLPAHKDWANIALRLSLKVLYF